MKLSLTATLIGFGLTQSIIMIFLIVKNRNWKEIPNRLLISLLLIIGVSLLPTFLGNSGLVQRYDYLKFLPFNLAIFIFPILYMYISAICNHSFELNRKNNLHLIIPFVFFIYHTFIWLSSLSVSSELKGTWAGEMGYFKIQFIHNVLLLIFVCIYSILSYLEIRKNQKTHLTKRERKYHRWIIYLLVFFVIGVLFELTSTLIGRIYGYWKSSPLDDWLGFSLTMAIKIYNAVLIYVISLTGYLTYSNFKQNQSNFNNVGVNKKLEYIINTMETKKPFLSKTFSLTTFSKQLQMTPANLSNLLNTHLKLSFNDFTNKYRINEIKDKLLGDAYNNFTIESIAEDAGFKSKTTFYRAFYKFTSKTPKEYIEQMNSKKIVS